MGPAALTDEDRRLAQEMLNLINATRRQHNVAPLLLNDRLCQVAKGHAYDMKRRGYQSHSTPEGIDVGQRVSSAGVVWRAVGENIAGNPTHRQGQTIISGYRSIQEGHLGLLSSAGHRANILGDYHEVGIGIATNPDETFIIVQVFIKR